MCKPVLFQYYLSCTAVDLAALCCCLFYFILFLFLGAKVSPELVAEKNKHYIRGLCEHFTIFCRMYSVRGAVQNKIILVLNLFTHRFFKK